MAKRRMFLCELLQSDDFSSLPIQSQILYIHLNLDADDDGLLGKPNSIVRFLGIPKKYLTILAERGYILCFDSGVIAITHWLLHNKIRRDRYTETRFIKEISSLRIIRNSYIKADECEAGQGVPAFFDNQSATEDSIVEVSSEKDNEEKDSLAEGSQNYGSRKKDSDDFSTQKCGKPHEEGDDEEFYKFDGDAEFRKSLSEEEILKYVKILRSIKLCFISKKALSEYDRFVTYNEKRGWVGKNGEKILDKYEIYIEEWLKRKKEFFFE